MSHDDFWHSNVEEFVSMVAGNPGFWRLDPQMKYLELRIDTRNGDFTLKDRDGNFVHPNDVQIEIAEWNQYYREKE